MIMLGLELCKERYYSEVADELGLDTFREERMRNISG